MDTVKVVAVDAINWLVEKWQVFRNAIESNPVLKFIFQPLVMAADIVGFLIAHLDKIPQWFASFKNWLAGLPSIIFATHLISDSSGCFSIGWNVKTTELVVFEENCLCVTRRTVCILVGKGSLKLVDLSMARSIFF